MPTHTQLATITTSLGPIRVNLLGNHAPRTVANFVGLATGEIEWTHPASGARSTAPFYDGVIFHRIIKDFMLQAGDPLGQGTGGPGYNFDDEIHPELSFAEPYVLAMANAGQRRNAITGKLEGTNGSQFFITTVPTPWLQGKHTIFGFVADDESRAVVDAIEAVETGRGDKPIVDVVIESVTIEQA
jgi:peptidyl-prolyl cis-trans isomerase A (cyclophilin A)